MSDILNRINDIKNKISSAAIKAGRNPEEILLLGVTKTVDVDVMNEAIDLGITDVGENKPQELSRKYNLIDKSVKWHQIGSLQTNKVKYIIDKVSLIHSLDRISLAEEINRRAEQLDIEVDCLVQVNISREITKHGLLIEEVEEFIKQCASKYNHIRIVGLMTMAPFDVDEDEIRMVFRKLKQLSEKIDSLKLGNVEMRELSMGMSQDFEIAIEEGATIVRVGTSIFGKRNYT